MKFVAWPSRRRVWLHRWLYFACRIVESGGIEVEDPVEDLASSQELIQYLTLRINLRAAVGSNAAIECRGQRGGINLNAWNFPAQSCDALSECFDYAIDGHIGPEIIDAFHPNYRLDARKAYDVPVKTRNGSGTTRYRFVRSIFVWASNPVASDALINDRKFVAVNGVQTAR